MESELFVIHFNDVYHVPSENILSRFLQLKKSFVQNLESSSDALTIFSGDAFSRSLEASVLKGAHMAPVLSLVGVDVTCYGNHDFDFGDTRLIELSRQVRFPWVLSNAFHRMPSGENEPGRLLADAAEYVIKTINGTRIGFFGLAGTDWPSNCSNLPSCKIDSPVKVAQRLASYLRAQERCDLVIAVTHMRLEEDMAVAMATENGSGRVDLFLGGHDHEVVRRFAGDTDSNPGTIEQGCSNADITRNGRVQDTRGRIRIIKSGTDWRGLSLVRLVLRDNTLSSVHLTQYIDITQSAAAPEQASFTPSSVDDPLFHTAACLEGRGAIVRSQETNLGNMLGDAVRAFYDTDTAFFNSGAIRCDRVFLATTPNAQPLQIRDMIDICPFENPLVVKRISGHVLRQAMENSISDLHMDGRFLHISGIPLTATWQRPSGHRILDLVLDRGEPDLQTIQPTRMYSVAMSKFIADRYDGYTDIPASETVVSEEAAMSDTGLMLEILRRDPEKAEDSPHACGIQRARKAIVKGRMEDQSLPVVSPCVDGRIRFLEYLTLQD